MAARVYAGEDWYVQDGGGTGRIECLYERARSGVGDVKFVLARLTAEDRWASDGRRAARTDVEQGGVTARDAGRAASERAAVGGAGGSAGEGADDKGAGGDSRGAGLQGCRVEGEGYAEMGRATGDECGGCECVADSGGGEGGKGGVGAGDNMGGKVEAGVAAAVRGREAAGLAEGRTQEKGAARRLWGMTRGG